ncbi:MAG: transglutaminase-like domain-containing protein, partial [Lachnospiraceae bacterium]|nr:transglutaminase-like domain-containing protein [Lachnospiraceae bacterium]
SVRYIAAAVIVLFFNMVPIYMELEPDFIYLIMLVAGFLICYLIRSGQHYLLHRSESIYKYFSTKPLYLRVYEWLKDGFKKLKKRLKGEKEFPWESLENQNKEKKNKDDLEIKTLRYSIDAKSMGQMCLIGLSIVIVVVAISNIISPKDDYKDTHEDNRFKQASVAILANAVSLGIGSVFNYYENNGGLSGGVLGGIGTVRFDYQPDITVKFAPYSYDTIYVKNFIGQSYKPYRNRWMQPMDYKEPTEQFYYETKALKKAYDEGAEYSAKGKMVVENKAGNMGIYVPYYSGGENDFLRYGVSKEYTYYPRFAESLATVEPREISDAYLLVPDDNMEAIRDFATEAGLSSSDEPLVTVQKVADYYQENIPYTIRPGATSYREDFINYFLTKNRKGYCAHFASAATLLFRYCGIPARYCEGYAIPYEDVTGDGEIVNNEKYSDYYNGYTEIGETAVIEVSASDANAHAWVEIYTEQYGWIVADVTPSAGEEDTYDDFWSVFDRITGRRNGSDSEDDSTATGPNINLSIDKKTIDFITYAIAFLVMLFVVIIVTIPSYRFLRKKVIYARSNTSDKLIIKYNDQIRRWQRIEKRSQFVNKKDNEAEKNLESTLSDCINYRSQVEYLEKNNTIMFTDKSLKERMISILEKAGFSNSIISDEEFKFVNRYLKK